jgi:hypothetical protein
MKQQPWEKHRPKKRFFPPTPVVPGQNISDGANIVVVSHFQFTQVARAGSELIATLCEPTVKYFNLTTTD